MHKFIFPTHIIQVSFQTSQDLFIKRTTKTWKIIHNEAKEIVYTVHALRIHFIDCIYKYIYMSQKWRWISWCSSTRALTYAADKCTVLFGWLFSFSPFCFILAVSLSLILSLIVHAEQHCDCLYKRAFFSGLPFEIFYKHTQSSFSFTMFFRFFINNNCEQSFNPPKNKIKKLTKPINTIIAAIRYSLRGQCTTSSLIHCFIGLFNFSWEYFETAAWNIQSIILTDEWHDRFADWIFVFFVSLKPSQFWISIEPFFWYIEGLLSNNFQK